MLSIGWTLRTKRRLLELSTGGRWYLGFTVALGVVAIYSGNNVIYLLESLLLSALLLSGILSEYTISQVTVSRSCENIHAGRLGDDVFLVENRGRIPLYCLELGEWCGGKRVFTAFLLALPPHARVKVRSRQLLAERGRHRWDGLMVGTSFPFGFARKVRLLEDPGTRIVWPHLTDPGRWDAVPAASRRGELEMVSGEVCPLEPGQDAKRIHWPASLRSGELMARPLSWNEPRTEVRLVLGLAGAEQERRISKAAGALAQRAEVLVLVSKSESKRVEGVSRSLDILALLPKESA